MNISGVLGRVLAASAAWCPECAAQVPPPSAHVPHLRCDVVVHRAVTGLGDPRGPVVLQGQPLEVIFCVVNVDAQAAQEAARGAMDRWRMENETGPPDGRTPPPDAFKLDDELRVRLQTGGDPWWQRVRIELHRLGSGQAGDEVSDSLWIAPDVFAAALVAPAGYSDDPLELGVDSANVAAILPLSMTSALPPGAYEVQARALSGDLLADDVSQEIASTVINAAPVRIIVKPVTSTSEMIEMSFDAGRFDMRNGFTLRAIDEFRRVDQFDADYYGGMALALLGECLEQNGQLSDALTAYKKFASMHPEHELGWISRVKSRIEALEALGVVPAGG